MKTKIAIIGDGYLGSSFRNTEVPPNQLVLWYLSYYDITVLGKDDLVFGSCYSEINILDEYDVIVNCIAKSNTRFCEENYSKAFFSNVEVAKQLSDYCNFKGKKYVHISTGCLYDQNNRPQLETDSLAAHCNYTLTKWQAEKVIEDNPDALIIRPRLLFDERNKHVNLLVKLSKFDKLCNEFDSITSIDVLKDATLALIKADCSGVFNVACEGFTSMYDIGQELGFNASLTSIQEIRIQQGLHLVNNIMDISKLKQFYQPPHILDEVKRCYNVLKG